MLPHRGEHETARSARPFFFMCIVLVDPVCTCAACDVGLVTVWNTHLTGIRAGGAAVLDPSRLWMGPPELRLPLLNHMDPNIDFDGERAPCRSMTAYCIVSIPSYPSILCFTSLQAQIYYKMRR